nr:MAG TPA: hypothetical protein [Caudoviricetes sp.]DAY24242.1 MAG TPA: hypothetical protein [Caudoviricetes sp.]
MVCLLICIFFATSFCVNLAFTLAAAKLICNFTTSFQSNFSLLQS